MTDPVPSRRADNGDYELGGVFLKELTGDEVKALL